MVVRTAIKTLRQSYALKLGLAFVLVIGVVSGYAVISTAETTDAVRESATDTLRTDATQTGEAVGTWFSKVEAQTRSVAASTAASSGSASEVRQRLRELEAGGLGDGVVAVQYVRLSDTPESVAAVGAGQTVGDAGPAIQQTAGATPTGEVGHSELVGVPFVDRDVLALVAPVDGADAAVVTYVRPSKFIGDLTGSSTDGNIVLVDSSREIVGASMTDRVGSTHGKMGGTIPAVASGEQSGGVMTMTMSHHGEQEEMFMAFATVPDAEYTVMVHEPRAAALGIAQNVQATILGGILLGLTGLAIVGGTVGSSTVIRLRQLRAQAEEMAGGNLDVDLSSRRTDEFGDLYASLDTMRTSLQDRISEVETARAEAEEAQQEAEELTTDLRQTAAEYAIVLDDVSEGNLTRRLETEGRRKVMQDVATEVNEVLTEFEESIQALDEFAANVSESAEVVTTEAAEASEAAESVSTAIAEISDDVDEQTTQLQDLGAEIESLSATAEEIAASSNDVSATSSEAASAAAAGAESAGEAIEQIDRVVEVISETAETIEQLDEDMEEIGEVADLIGDIADETNLLALNASIEAARAGGDGGAGDAGQGFAVVADEVKDLAEETKQSADEIEAQIDAVQAQTDAAVTEVLDAQDEVTAASATVEDTLSELETIATRIEETDQSVTEISSATEDQAQSTQTASATVDEVRTLGEATAEEAESVTSATVQQSEAVSSVTERARQLRDEAQTLQDSLAQFSVRGDDRGAGDAHTLADNQVAATDDD
ncbi:methyl-accepting chemotaxis protein [Halobaculum sp. MBLA0147]|uniref:methyl-accepting chemotaxis protein n=1 Tax=Halobaculum sp. MBLA0147 TaxID=3079934 RepID=UPI0035251943